MRISIREGDNGKLYKRAKQEFKYHYIRQLFSPVDDFWQKLGEANNMKVIIKEWQGPFPVVEALEFENEADYVWFVLRWS